MEQNGKSLSMHNDAIWKGTYTHNGMLLKIHENDYTIGYSQLLKADGTAGASVKFGDGVFLDASQNNNRAYAGSPTVLGAIPVFGGIVVREPAIASGYPVKNDEVAPFQKGLLCREGFVEYKKGNLCTASSTMETDIELFGKVFPNFCIWVNKTNGKVYFSPKSTVYYQSGDLMIGRVVASNPDDRTLTVKVTPVLQADTTDIAGATPSITVTSDDITNTEIPFVSSQGIEGDIVVSYKLHSGSTYTVLGTFTPTLNEAGTAFEASIKLEGLTKNTAYDIKVELYSACGLKSDTESNVSTANES